ncbi:MAG: hypothetical protein ABIM74_06250 [candidate division WOR-3 bacterium]
MSNKGLWLALILVALFLLLGLLILPIYARQRRAEPPLPEPEIPEPETDISWLSSLLEGYELPASLPEDEKSALEEARVRFRQKGASFVHASVKETIYQIANLLDAGPEHLIPARIERLRELLSEERERWEKDKERHIAFLRSKEPAQKEPDLTIRSMLKDDTGEELGGKGIVIQTGWAGIEVAIGAIEEVERLERILSQTEKPSNEVATEVVEYHKQLFGK